MTPILLVSIFGSIFILLLIMILLFVIWRNKRQRHHEFERLLDDINERQASRSNSLVRRLAEKFKLDQTKAQDLSGQLIVAEKLFLQQFIQQQLQQKSIENMYDQLCDLLDSYLNVLPNQERSTEKPLENTATNPAPPDSTIDSEMESGEDEAQAIRSEDDWDIEA